MKVHFQRQLKDKKFKYVQQLSLEIKNSNSNFIAAASNKSRAAWSVLRKSISSNNRRSIITELHLDGQVVKDVQTMANAFNLSFISPEPIIDVPFECIGPSSRESFFLNPVSVHEVQCYLQSIPSKKAAA
jgi:hypothetical protein